MNTSTQYGWWSIGTAGRPFGFHACKSEVAAANEAHARNQGHVLVGEMQT